MSILSTEQLGHSFNDNWLFQDLFLGLARGERKALVGVNGTGKSTLLKILAGRVQPGNGTVVKERDLKIGYLEQDPDFGNLNTVSDFIYSAENKSQQLIREYEEILLNHHGKEKRLEELTNMLTEENAWEYEHQIKTILGRLGIHNLEQKISTLSGGQRKRLALAKLLIDDPDLYILDEPTNHLDIETIEWLESFLTTGNKTILLVTHDRYFLDNVCNQILELDRGKIFSYNGNYAFFLEKKFEKAAQEQATFEKNSNLLRRELEWMRRQPKARTTKSQARIDAFHELEAKTKNKPQNSTLELSVKTSRQGGKILELHNITKSYGPNAILTPFTYIFKKGDKIGVAGKNGMGKSTLLNIITGAELPDAGTVSLGDTTVFGYYKQGGLEFDDSDRVIDVVTSVAEYITMADGKTLTASQVLTHFLFPPSKQFGMVKKLSGGEKKRLQLMRVLMKNPNFLILDEPTNDLDIDTLNVLEDFLMNFPGILMLVSHDRYLMDKLTSQLFILEGEGRLLIYNGNYTEYRESQQEQLKSIKESPKLEVATSLPSSNGSRKLSFKEQKELETIEKDIQQLEEEIANLTSELNSGNLPHEHLTAAALKIEEKQNILDEKSIRWIELSELT